MRSMFRAESVTAVDLYLSHVLSFMLYFVRIVDGHKFSC